MPGGRYRQHTCPVFSERLSSWLAAVHVTSPSRPNAQNGVARVETGPRGKSAKTSYVKVVSRLERYMTMYSSERETL
jgi:hypothetical protein